MSRLPRQVTHGPRLAAALVPALALVGCGGQALDLAPWVEAPPEGVPVHEY